jgi:Protein of unknown function (DUF1064)
MRRAQEREAWTAFVEGREAAKQNKYGVAPKEERGKYASKHEAIVAGELAALQRAGKIKELREQVRIVLMPKNGKLRAITYIADFQYRDLDGMLHTLDAKGYKTPVYRLKKKVAAHMLGLEIEEV